MSLTRPAAALALMLPLAHPCATSQNPSGESAATLKVKVNLVLLPTKVTSSEGVPIGTLTKENFQIFENGRQQELGWFAPIDAPVDVALVMDVSGSTAPFQSLLKKAATQFVDRFGPADQLALYSVGPDVVRVTGFTSNRQEIKKAIGQLRWDGKNGKGSAVLKSSHGAAGTLLYDGMVAVQKEFAEDRRRRVILVFTDSMDAGSTTSFDTLNYLTLQSSAMVFAVMPHREAASPDALAQLLKQPMDVARDASRRWKNREKKKPPAGSSADKDWLLVLDLSAVHDSATQAQFEETAREFLAELAPSARVRLFDYRNRLRPILFPTPGDQPAILRDLSPDEAAALLPLSANPDFYPKLPPTDTHQVQVDKVLVLTDLKQSGLPRLMKSLTTDSRDFAVITPEKLADPQERRAIIQLLVHHPVGMMLASVAAIDRVEAMEKAFQNLARDTGGMAFLITGSGKLDQAYDEIASHIRSSYTLGYYARLPGHHVLEVRVRYPTAVVHSRRAVIVQ